MLDRPITVWWATPPSPRSDISGFNSWGELLAVHELTHVAHLTRPTRNPFQRMLWSLSPAELGPVAQSCIDEFSEHTSSLSYLGAGESIDAVVPEDACRVFGPIPPDAASGDSSARP